MKCTLILISSRDIAKHCLIYYTYNHKNESSQSCYTTGWHTCCSAAILTWNNLNINKTISCIKRYLFMQYMLLVRPWRAQWCTEPHGPSFALGSVSRPNTDCRGIHSVPPSVPSREMHRVICRWIVHFVAAQPTRLSCLCVYLNVIMHVWDDKWREKPHDAVIINASVLPPRFESIF